MLRTPEEHYDYGSFSAHTGWEAVGRSLMYLFRDLRTPDALSLFIISGADKNRPCCIRRPKTPCQSQGVHGPIACDGERAFGDQAVGPFEAEPWQEWANVLPVLDAVV